MSTAAVSIRAEVTAQTDYVTSILDQVELFVQIKQTEKYIKGTIITLCYSRMSLEITTEKMASVPGPKRNSCRKINRRACPSPVCIRTRVLITS